MWLYWVWVILSDIFCLLLNRKLKISGRFLRIKKIILPQEQNHNAKTAKSRIHFKAKPQWVIDEVIRLAALMPNSGCRPIAETFNRLHERKREMTVGKTYVANKLKNHLYTIQCLRKEIKNKPAKVFPKNQQWAMDLTQIKDDNGDSYLALGIIDAGTRYCLNLQTVNNKASINLLRLLLDTIEVFGKPKVIKTDNERCFTSVLFCLVFWILGIKHRRSERFCPWQNGKIERLFWTLKDCLKHYTPSNISLVKELDQFRFWYNHCRPHQALKGKVPAEQYRGRCANKEGIAYYRSYWGGALSGFYLPPD